MPQIKVALFFSQKANSANIKSFSENICDLRSYFLSKQDDQPSNLKTRSINLNFKTSIKDAWQFLSVSEKVRANKILDKNKMEAYILAHASLRLLLAEEIGTKPLEIVFTFGAHGKPQLNGKGISTEFNISYTKDAFAIIIGNSEVGIDIEFLRYDFDFNGVAKKMFSYDEFDWINSSLNKREALIIFFQMLDL